MYLIQFFKTIYTSEFQKILNGSNLLLANFQRTLIRRKPHFPFKGGKHKPPINFPNGFPRQSQKHLCYNNTAQIKWNIKWNINLEHFWVECRKPHLCNWNNNFR